MYMRLKKTKTGSNKMILKLTVAKFEPLGVDRCQVLIRIGPGD